LLVPALALGIAACDDEDDPTDPVVDDNIVEIASTTPELSTLTQALQAADLVQALQAAGPFTVFAPDDAAFAALPAGELERLLQPENQAELQEVLQYHVVPGELFAADLSEGQTLTTLTGETLEVSLSGGASVNGASVTQADIEAVNGVIHIIDAVLLPPQPTITEVAAATPDLSTLVDALTTAELDDDLAGDGPFTVFAPVNSAFDALGADVVAALLQEGNRELLTDILGYHVVPGAAVESGDLTDGQTVTTLQGEELTIGVSNGDVTVNGANVVTADVEAANGVVHLVDGVLVPEVDIVEQAILTPATQTLVAAIIAGDLVETLKGDGPFTVFAPDNAAFEALEDYTLAQLLDPANQELLQKVLTYHVVPGDIRAADLSDGATVTTVQGQELTIDLSSGQSPMVNDAAITATDIVVSNGVIHLIDGVLLPELDIVETAALTETTATLVDAVAAAELVETLKGDGPFTVFAPTNEAFDELGEFTLEQLLDPENQELLQKVLTYHVVPGDIRAEDLTDGGTVTTVEGSELTFDLSDDVRQVNGTDIIATDVVAQNGVIHLIDGVLTQNLDIVDVASTTESTQTLATAVAAAELVETLQGDGPFTVFAPTNEAFEAVDDFTLEQLLDPENQALLQEVLTYHVVPGDIRAADLTDGATVTTVQGQELTIDLSGETPMVNDADIIATDVVAANGVVHLIDGVLLPELDIVETATVTEATQTLVTAVAAADLEETLKGDGPFTVFAPDNEAFEALDDFTLEQLLDSTNVELLQKVLTYHVVPGDIRAADLTDGATVTTVQGQEVTIDLSGETPMVNDANIVATDVVAENGVIHLIDGVLLPELDIVETATVTQETQTLAAAVAAGDLVETLQGDGPFTVFAPVEAAFEALGTDQLEVLLDPANQELLQKVLTYHVVPGDIRAADLTDGAMVTTVEGTDLTIDLSGETPMVNGANIIATDVVTENGVIHLIDGVLTENLDLVDVATVNGFGTLVSLVEQQGLTATLRTDNMGDGFTVFAPTEDAFAALETVPEGDALTDVLLYHVVGATVGSGDLSDGQVVETLLEGATFTVNIDGGVTITDGAGNTVNVTVTDVQAANGVIHVVDAVLLPAS
jgi:uncharacterized surface protein with fasciclin (FAS1) repeats